MKSLKSIIGAIRYINQELVEVNNRLSRLDVIEESSYGGTIFGMCERYFYESQNSLWDKKIELMDQKDRYLDMLVSIREEEALIAHLVAERMPDTYKVVNTSICGIPFTMLVKRDDYSKRRTDIMTEMEICKKKGIIDSRVARLEKVNDEWIAKHGESNKGIMDLINELMDERDSLCRR